MANRVRYQSQLHEMGGQDQYLATMNHWSTSLPRRLPGLEFVTLNALCTEPGVLVMRQVHLRGGPAKLSSLAGLLLHPQCNYEVSGIGS